MVPEYITRRRGVANGTIPESLYNPEPEDDEFIVDIDGAPGSYSDHDNEQADEQEGADADAPYEDAPPPPPSVYPDQWANLTASFHAMQLQQQDFMRDMREDMAALRANQTRILAEQQWSREALTQYGHALHQQFPDDPSFPFPPFDP